MTKEIELPTVNGQQVAKTNTEEVQVSRDNILLQIRGLFASESRIVTLEGDDGIGKTTLMRQFVETFKSSTVFLFISSASRWAYDPEGMAIELEQQVSRLLKSEPQESTERQSDYQRELNALARRARSTKMLCYFVIDGLDDIPESDTVSRQQIISLLPFGVENFRFLIAGAESRLSLNASAKKTHRAILLSPFTREEASRYLADLKLTDAQTDDVYTLAGGIPGSLSSIRRILSKAENNSQEIANLPQSLPALFMREWTQVDNASEDQVCFSRFWHMSKKHTPRLS